MHSPYLRNSRWGLPSISHGSKEDLCRFLVSASLHNCFHPRIHTYSKYSRSSYLSRMLLQTQLPGYPSFNKYARSSCFFLAIFHNRSHLWLPSCTKILLTVCMRPAAITLNYSIKNIPNDIRQIIITIL